MIAERERQYKAGLIKEKFAPPPEANAYWNQNQLINYTQYIPIQNKDSGTQQIYFGPIQISRAR